MPLFRHFLPSHQDRHRKTAKNGRRSSGYGSKRQRGFELLEPRLVLASNPLITEFMASNDATINDGDGLSSDWVEIHNPTSASVNLAGWHLTDNATNLDKWTFPAAPQSVLDPGEYLIVFASGKNTETYIDPAGYLHTDFNLDADGEYLALTDADNAIVHEYAPGYQRQIEDVSFGLLSNATSVTLVGPTQVASALVPTSGALDAPSAGVAPAWTVPAFNDSAWSASSGGVGVGFDFGDDAQTNVPNGTLLPAGLIGFDLTDADENGAPDGTLTAGGFGSPNNEEPPRALDNTEGTKWLAFEPEGTFYQFRFAGGQRHAVNGYTITSANDAPDRDPYSWTLSGSNDGVNYTVVDTRSAQDFAERFETRLYEFSNDTTYEYYRFDFQTEFGVTGQNQPNSIQMAEIELFSSGPVDYDPLIDLDVEPAWLANKSSVYQRIEFNVADPAAFASLMLEMQYEDGFVAYLNGKRVAAANAPALPNFQATATGERDDADSLDVETFNLSANLGDLVAGTNVLAIHVLNIDDNSPDLLSVPRLIATQLIDDTVVEAYMPQPTPGAANSSVGVTPGPIILNVTENPPQPLHNQNLVITAEVEAAGTPIANVDLYYRVMYNSEVVVEMNDGGTNADLVAGDGIFTGVIPESAYTAGQMVRWYVTAEDTVGDDSRFPLFIKPTASAEYLGTVAINTSYTTALPVFEYFVENVSASGTEIGTRGSVFFRGEFYDNVFVRRRGGNTTQGRKFEFNDGQHFLFDPEYPRVDEINLNERGAEPTYMRQVLAWEVYGLAGAPASIGEAWYTRLNNSYLDVRIFVEQPDADLLARTGLDPNGAFYKIGADGVENSVTSSTTGVRKRTRKNEDNSDLAALVNGVRPTNANSETYVFDNIDIAGMINYIAATSIMHDNDAPHKNFHLYRDTEGTRQWTMLPWDKDLTFGLNFGFQGIVADVDPFGHPFFGDQEHQKIDNQWNRMIDAVFDIPLVREMYVRRLRTLMDQFILPPGAGQPSWIETRVGELRQLLQPHMTSGNWLNNVNRIVNEYLVERRNHLYVDHSINNPGYPDNARIPDAQVGNPTIQFGQIEVIPASGNQNQEYVQLMNPNNTAVDISNWRIEGGIRHTFRPGTVIPAGGSLYISPSVPDFLARTTGPRGGQQLFVQGNYSGQLKDMGEEPLRLVAADGSFMAQVGSAIAGDYNEDLVVNTPDYDLWRANFGSTSVVNPDGNANGVVDAADYVLWRKQFSAAQASAAAIEVVSSSAVALPSLLITEATGPQQAANVELSLLDTPRLVERRVERSIAAIPRRGEFAASRDLALLAVLEDRISADAATGESSVASAVDGEDDAVESIDEVFAALAL